MLKSLIFVLAAALFSSCFQAHSDDSLRLVPTTNNPHIIQDSSKTANAPPGIGY
jgi:hypothetical protein